MNRDDMAAMRAAAQRAEDAYRAHFDDCPDCPSSPDGECARARELYRAWDASRELPAFQCTNPKENRTMTTPSVTTFGETAALYALMEGDREEAKRICGDMSRNERAEFALQLVNLTKIVQDLNAPRCAHCRSQIAKVPAGRVRGGSPGEEFWFHVETLQGTCAAGDTVAEPEPLED